MPEKKSLKGLRVLVGRARHQASALAAGLRFQGAEVVEIPFIEIRRPRSYKALDGALRDLEKYNWLILTSVNGVTAVWERARKLRLSKRSFSHLKIAAIGPATKKALQERGMRVHVMPDEYVAEAVVHSLRGNVKNQRVLLARARVARDVIPQELRKEGAVVDVAEAYETVVPNRSRMRLRTLLADERRRPHFITFTSSSTVKNFLALLGSSRRTKAQLRGIQFASIGPITSATMRDAGLRVHTQAIQYTIPGLIRAIANLHKDSG
jgi:uroporphyrinogen-III synthase